MGGIKQNAAVGAATIEGVRVVERFKVPDR
jgi:hypothetical protein